MHDQLARDPVYDEALLAEREQSRPKLRPFLVLIGSWVEYKCVTRYTIKVTRNSGHLAYKVPPIIALEPPPGDDVQLVTV